MKKILMTLALVLVLFSLACVLVGCGGGEGTGTQSGGTDSKVTIIFDANGGTFGDGSTTKTQQVEKGSTLTAPETPRRNGFTFGGWTLSGQDWNFGEQTVNENMTLKASWRAETASIMSIEGATINGTEAFMLVDHTVEVVSLASKVVCNDGSTWKMYYDRMGQVEIPTKMAASTLGELLDGDNVFYLVVTSRDGTCVETYTLTVHRSYLATVSFWHGEELLHTDSTYTGYPYTVSYTPDITGYTFHGWRGEALVLTPWDDVTYAADATANSYAVTLNPGKGSVSTTGKTLTYDSTYTLPVPTREGYSFLGWYSGTVQLTDSRGDCLDVWEYASAKTLTAEWQANSYSLTLNRNDTSGGTVSGGGTYTYGNTVTIKATTNNGYTFLGWYEGNTLVSEGATYTFTMGLSKTLTARWAKYCVTVSNEDTAKGTTTTYTQKAIRCGDTVTLQVTKMNGYNFLGWYEDGECLSSDGIYSFTMTGQDRSIVARWGEEATLAYTLSGSTYTVTGIGRCSGNVVIPASYVGVKVTAISASAFYNCSGLTQVTIGNGVTSIGEDAFRDCTGLTSITIPDSVTSIGYQAFYGCSSLVSMTLPFVGATLNGTSNTHFGYIFGAYYYYNNDEYVPESLKSVTVLGGSIGNYAFEHCTGLASVTIPDSVTSIGSWAFEDCTGLTAVHITDLAAWCGISFGTSSANPLYYAGKLYLNGTLVTDLVIPEGVTSIGGSAFRGCTGLTSVTIPDSVTSIGGYAFYECTSLTSVTISDSVTSIGTYAFYGCTGLTAVHITDLGAWCGISFGSSAANPLYWAGNLYLNGRLVTNLEIPDSVTGIGSYAFYGCTGLTSVTIGSGIIGEYAFLVCTGLTQVTIGNGVESIGDYAFKGCTGLTSITIPDSVTSIGLYAFCDCTSLTSVTIGKGAKSIDNKAFRNCDSLTSIVVDSGNSAYHSAGNCLIETATGTLVLGCKNSVIPTDGSVTSIGSCAFEDCTGLTSITIPDSVTSIGSSAFRGCTGLTCITIPDSVTSIGDHAFYSCHGLVEVINLSSLTITAGSSGNGYVGYYAKEVHSGNSKIVNQDGYLFYTYGGTHYLMGYVGEDADLILPENYLGQDYEIYEFAFYQRSDLTSVTIPDSVTRIGRYAFRFCDSLTQVTIRNGVESIGDYAFNGCTGLTSITIPDSVTSIGNQAFYGCDSLTSVTFADPEGWYVASSSTATSGTSLTLTDAGKNATSLRNQNPYTTRYWFKK